MFAVLRLFFFKPALAGLTHDEKVERVGQALQAPR